MVRADFFFVFLLLFVPSCLWAVDATNKKNEKRHEKRHIVYGGYSAPQGGVFKKPQGDFFPKPQGDTSQNFAAYPVRLGYSYIARDTFVVGCFFEPALIDESHAELDVTSSIGAVALGPYIGFKQPEGRFIVTGGFTYSKAALTVSKVFESTRAGRGSGFGLTFGAGCICDKMMIGARLSTYRLRFGGDFESMNNRGSAFGFDAGYVF